MAALRRRLGIGLLLLTCVNIAAGNEPGLYKPEDGPHPVETSDLTLVGDKRTSDLPVRIHHPAEGGPFPVIVFSHGLGGFVRIVVRGMNDDIAL